MSRITPIFIGGCPRSGTTFLADVLGSANSCLVTPESQFKTEVTPDAGKNMTIAEYRREIADHWRFHHWLLTLAEPAENRVLRAPSDYGDAILDIVRDYAQKQGTCKFSYWIDHTPSNLEKGYKLAEMFSGSRFIHIVRDPRAVIASVIERDWGPNTVRSAAHWWLQKTAFGFALEHAEPQSCIRVRYEDVVSDTEAEIDRLFSWIDVEAEIEPTVGNFEVPAYSKDQHQLIGQNPDITRISKWKDSLTNRQVEIIEHELGTMLWILGYHQTFDTPSAIGKMEVWEGRLKEGLFYLYNRLRRRWRTYTHL